MADVFLSYSRQDRDTALEISHYLQQNALTVWSDSALSAGQSFQDTISQELKAAKAVIVVWSKHSIKSAWVQAEASQALTSRKLVSLKTNDLDVEQIPPPFNSLRIIDIVEAKGSDVVLEAVRRLAGVPEPPMQARLRSTGQLEQDTIKPPAASSGDLLMQEEHYDAFVAYSRKDRPICEEVVLALRSQELIVFYDQSLKSGERWRTVIANNIEKTPVFVALVSKESMASTEVQDEVNLAKGSTASILPVRIDTSELTSTFKLMLGNINIIDASQGREAVFRQLALQIKTTVALRAFAARRTNQDRMQGDLKPSIQLASPPVDQPRNSWLPIAAAIVLMASTAACAVAMQNLQQVAQFALVERILLSLVTFGVPYTLVCMAAAKSLFR